MTCFTAGIVIENGSMQAGIGRQSNEEEIKMTIVKVAKGYSDQVLENPHQVVRGENVFTCNMALMQPQTLVGQTVVCGKCGEQFKVEQGDDQDVK